MYKLINGLDGKLECILYLNNTVIPINELNTDYQIYLKWVEEGNTPLPADTTQE